MSRAPFGGGPDDIGWVLLMYVAAVVILGGLALFIMSTFQSTPQ